MSINLKIIIQNKKNVNLKSNDVNFPGSNVHTKQLLKFINRMYKNLLSITKRLKSIIKIHVKLLAKQ